jgi:hypothetical protein
MHFTFFRWLVCITSLDVSTYVMAWFVHPSVIAIARAPQSQSITWWTPWNTHCFHPNCLQVVATLEPKPAVCTSAHLPASLRFKSPPPQAPPAACTSTSTFTRPPNARYNGVTSQRRRCRHPYGDYEPALPRPGCAISEGGDGVRIQCLAQNSSWCRFRITTWRPP